MLGLQLFHVSKRGPRFDLSILVMLNFSEKVKIYFHFLSFFNTVKLQIAKCFVVVHKDPFSLCSQYHGCKLPGDTRSQGIISHGIGLVILEYFGISIRRVNKKSIYSKGSYPAECNGITSLLHKPHQFTMDLLPQIFQEKYNGAHT